MLGKPRSTVVFSQNMKLSLITVAFTISVLSQTLWAQSQEQLAFLEQTRQLPLAVDSLFPAWDRQLGQLLAENSDWSDSLVVNIIRLAGDDIDAGHPALGVQMMRSLEQKMQVSKKEDQHLLLYSNLVSGYCDLLMTDSMSHYLELAAQELPKSNSPTFYKIFLTQYRGNLAMLRKNNLEALELYTKAMLMVEEAKMWELGGAIKVGMMDLYIRIQHYQRCIDLGAAELRRADLTLSDLDRSGFYNNLGVAYSRVGKLDSAALLYREAAVLSQQMGHKINEARAYTNLGNTLLKKKEYSAALEAMNTAFKICGENGLEVGIFINTVNKAELLSKMGDFAGALELFKKAQQMAKLYSDPAVSKDLDRVGALVYSGLGDYKTAFQYQLAYQELMEEAHQKQNELLVLDWEARVERERQDQYIEELSEEIEYARRRQQFFYALALLVLVSVFLGYRLLVNKHHKDRLQAKLNREESQNLRLQLEMKDKEMASQSIHLQSIKAFSEGMTEKLRQFNRGLPLRQEEELSKLISEFEHRFPEELWEDFQMRFEKVNDSFYHKLMERCPDLSPVELRVAALLRLNLSSKEISDITNRSVGTISNTRSSLRKKLHLEDEANLVAYLISI